MSYIQGNICRIVMKDFLTFDEMEIRPKPHLNVIIGPNGSGKSAVLCGLCLVLAGKPDLTGRGKEVGAYIKHGKSESIIEVEIFVENRPAIKIRRTFNREGKSTWLLQGNEVRQKIVEAKVKDLGIQMNNLCQFLPQDKVVDFAKLNKIQLLEQTEMAVGEQELFEQHERLKSSSQSMQSQFTHLSEVQTEHDSEVGRNARLKDQVENHNLKKQLENEINSLQTRKLWWQYAEMRTASMRLKEEREEAKKEVQVLMKQKEPLENKIRSTKDHTDVLKNKNKDQERICRNLESELDTHDNNFEKLDLQIAQVRRVYECQKIDDVKKVREIDDLRKQLSLLENQLQQTEEIDDNIVQQRVKQLTEELNLNTKKISDSSARRDQQLYERNHLNQSLMQLQNNQKQLQDVGRRKLDLLQRISKPAYQAVHWLENNRNKFSGTVYNPICTQINLKDQNYARYVEDRIARRDLTAFVCEDRDDMNKFKYLMDQQKIYVNIINSTPQNLSDFQPQESIESLQRLGFKSYMREMIDAPPAIMTYLCKNYNIHRIPVALKGDFDKMPHSLHFFYIGDSRYSKSQSKYDGAASTSIVPVKNPQLLIVSLDTDKLTQISNDIKELMDKEHQVEKELKRLNNEVNQIEMIREQQREEKRKLSQQKDQRNQFLTRIKQKQHQIAGRESDRVDLPDEEQKMKQSLKEITTEIVGVVKKRSPTQDQILKLMEGNVTLNLENSLHKQRISAWKEVLNNSQDQVKEMQALYEQKHALHNKRRLDTRNILTELVKNLGLQRPDQIDNTISDGFKKIGPQCLQTTEQKLLEVEAQRDCLITADDGIIRDYNKREIVIKKLAGQLEKLKNETKNDADELDACRKKWLPSITELVDNISNHFSFFMSRLGCAGEVVLEKGDNENDMSKYGLAIRVKFRDGEKLRELTAQQQSGGERAVSTALYLLALQRLSCVPFRCVDEINQGMDPLNERRMFKMLVETTSDKTASQYFLVTPKLLPNLPYNEHVNFIIVNNGPFLPLHRKLTFKKVLKIKKAFNEAVKEQS